MILGLAWPDFLWLAGAAFTAGMVRGFSGFGTAMIYLPVAGQFLSPFGAIITLVIMDLVAPLPNARRAWRDGDPADVARLGLGFTAVLPLGILTLTVVAPEVFRYAVSGLSLALLVCLVGGFRYRGALTRPMIYGAGGLGGFLGGVTGIAGPPVILLYMASASASQVVRANTLLYLILTDVVFLPMLALFGRLDGQALLLGLAMIVPGALGNIAGAFLFRPGYERTYRGVAYGVIALSALSGLPVWD